jgi:predicted amidohydrolase YtcJ
MNGLLGRRRYSRGEIQVSSASWRGPALACGLGVIAACGDGASAPGNATTVIFVNAHVVTMAPDGREAEAIAIEGDRIRAVGSRSELMALAGPRPRVIDVGGRTMLPGIVDAHTHVFNDAEQHLNLDLAGAQALALENGITTLGDPFVTEGFLTQMRAFDASGDLKIRTSLYLIHTNNCGVVHAGTWWTAHPPTRAVGERLRIGGIKLFADGGTCGSPAVSVEFEPGAGLGDLYLSADDIAAVVATAEATGHQAVIHASGDRAVAAALDGIERALGGRPNTRRHRIDHNSLTPAALIPRYAAIGIHPVLFGWRGIGECVPPAPPDYYQANWGNTRAFLDGLPGLHVAWHGDDPWVGPISPFGELHNMVTRVRHFEDGTECPAPDWQLHTRITAHEGLRMMTWNSAFALFRETEVGSLEPGKFADLIVVSADPLVVEPASLWSIQVLVTMVGGEVVFCRAGYGSLCPRL